MDEKNYIIDNNNYLKISAPKRYRVDFDKVNTLEDMKLILETIVFGFNVNISENYDKFDKVEKLLKIVE